MKGVIYGSTTRVLKGDARSLDNGSCGDELAKEMRMGTCCFSLMML